MGSGGGVSAGKYYLLATLHDSKRPLPYADEEKLPTYNGKKAKPRMRGTQILVGITPDGPFVPLGNSPAPPADLMTLDGTLFVEKGVPYMVYAHEWIQVLDGTIEAVPLKADLSAHTGAPFLLFKASGAPWVAGQAKKPQAKYGPTSQTGPVSTGPRRASC